MGGFFASFASFAGFFGVLAGISRSLALADQERTCPDVGRANPTAGHCEAMGAGAALRSHALAVVSEWHMACPVFVPGHLVPAHPETLPMSIASQLVFALFLSWFLSSPSHARENVTEFTWNGPLTPGRRVEISGLYGDIVVVPVMLPEIHLYARKHGLRDDPEQVQVRVDGNGDRLRICTTRPGHDDACDPVPGFENVLDRDTDVDMKLQLPLGTPLIARTTYGDIDLRGITAEVHAFTEQGRCRIETSRGGSVETTNGDIRLVLGRMLPHQELNVRSVNGKIRLDVPRDFDAEVTARTENGRVVADGATSVNGGVPRSGHWLFGEPRGHIHLETENGVIELHRR